MGVSFLSPRDEYIDYPQPYNAHKDDHNPASKEVKGEGIEVVKPGHFITQFIDAILALLQYDESIHLLPLRYYKYGTFLLTLYIEGTFDTGARTIKRANGFIGFFW
jgi:hypothetical protein